MSLPPKLIEEYAAFRERWEWALRGLKDADLAQSKLTYADMRDFLDRWQGKSGEPELEKGLSELRDTADRIALFLEAKFRETLLALIEKRVDQLTEKALFTAGLSFIKIMERTPPQLRPELERTFRDHNGYDFDAE